MILKKPIVNKTVESSTSSCTGYSTANIILGSSSACKSKWTCKEVAVKWFYEGYSKGFGKTEG